MRIVKVRGFASRRLIALRVTSVVCLARRAGRIDMHDRTREERQMRHELPVHVGGNLVSLFDGERCIDGDVHLCQ